MHDEINMFAKELAEEVVVEFADYKLDPQHPGCVLIARNELSQARLNLTPSILHAMPVSAAAYFSDVKDYESLLDAWQKAGDCLPFESDLPQAMQRVNPYANEFIVQLFEKGKKFIDAGAAVRIAKWVENFDIYTAVKCVESLLNSKADLTLLDIAEQKGWHVHFDHLAIRCGSSTTLDAERVMDLLREYHDYSISQIRDEQHYQFDDGWNAYMAYKLLENGQMIRLFIDQSDADKPKQIIQHWNHVYGYTAHHLAIRVTRVVAGERQAVPLLKIIPELEKRGIQVLTPTGLYSRGLLEQVFTAPEHVADIPATVKKELCTIDSSLVNVIENGKLLEVVSRKELSNDWKQRWYRLQGMEYQQTNPLHSVPVFNYFLPAQAAHVIRTSQQFSPDD